MSCLHWGAIAVIAWAGGKKSLQKRFTIEHWLHGSLQVGKKPNTLDFTTCDKYLMITFGAYVLMEIKWQIENYKDNINIKMCSS